MAAQTSYSIKAPAGSPGVIASADAASIASRFNEEAADFPSGVGVANGTNDDGGKLPAALTDLFAGVVVNSYGRDPSGLTTGSYLTKAQMPVLKRGVIWVSPEEAVTPASQVYMRVATSANDATLTQKGAFRATPDGVAQVTTITPTPLNSGVSVLRITPTSGPGVGKSYVVEFQADGSATAAEWVTGMKAAIAKDTQLTALLTTSGTSTLILTGNTAGMAFEVADVGDQSNAIAATTAPAPTAMLLNGCRYLDTCAAKGLARLEVDVSAVRQTQNQS